jgi:hypothetical protein
MPLRRSASRSRERANAALKVMLLNIAETCGRVSNGKPWPSSARIRHSPCAMRFGAMGGRVNAASGAAQSCRK